MATTSIWRVKGRLGKLISYVENPEKTEENLKAAGFMEEKSLKQVLAYAARADKTQKEGSLPDNGKEEGRGAGPFVTGLNCSALTAYQEMTAVKRRFNKTEGVAAYHGYQSFAPGECTPALAHEIGVRLAEMLWGDRYQVLVATHLDRETHLHTHFVVNPVSFVDGKRYHRTKEDYRKMRTLSDVLCREYALSVIEEPRKGQARDYGEWAAEKEGRPTWRGRIRSDVDACIREARTESQFYRALRRRGYQIKVGKDISVKPEGRERFFRLARNLGEAYGKQEILRKILEKEKNGMPSLPRIQKKRETVQGRRVSAPGNKRMTQIRGLRSRYYRYLYRLGILPKKGRRENLSLLREDIRKMEKLKEEIQLLGCEKIETTADLRGYQEEVARRMAELSARRLRLYSQGRRCPPGQKEEIREELASIAKEFADLRHREKICSRIEDRSKQLEEEPQKEGRQPQEAGQYDLKRKARGEEREV